jgi:3-oxoacyl-[acyl-carrier-protein] synthase I
MTPVGGEAAVVGLGMCAALGTDVVTNCAAARAGISRAAALEHYGARSAVEGTPEPVIGHQASLFTRGFEGEPRLVRLAQGALTDVLRHSAGVDWRDGHYGFYLSLPDAERIHTGGDLIADEGARLAWREAAAAREQDESPRSSNVERARKILEQAARLARWPGEVALRFASFSGHTGGLEAVRAAVSDLAMGATDVAVVLGADSLLDEPTLQWLHLRGRLKCDGAPAGLQPGEAGVAIVLNRTGLPTSTRSVASLRAVSVATEGRTLIGGESAAGEALTAVIADVWDAPTPESSWVICDQNGEFYRAMDWGHAVVRLRAQFEAFADPVMWYPALSFGDTGAASSLAGICMAVRAWERQYAPAATALVVAASDGEARAALTLTRSGGRR